MKIGKYLIICLTVFAVSCSVNEKEPGISLNSVGFLPEYKKEATVTGMAEKFMVKNSKNDSTVYSGKLKGPEYQEDVDQKVWTANFSDLEKPGKYYVEVPQLGKSTTFKIGEDVFNSVLKTSFRGFYLWRCGTSVSGDYKGNHFEHAECHMNDAYMDYIGEEGEIRDGMGGWHDAGDYGKYVVNAGVTLGNLFHAWDQYQDRIQNIDYNLPNDDPDYPEFLQEIKWETDWLLKMQYPDGSGKVSHKLTRTGFSDIIMPEQDTAKRYFTEWSSTATADFVAMMAMAARYFKPYDQEYADKCLDAAKKSYSFLKSNPEYKGWEQGDFGTGAYSSEDKDDRLWAAAEMWETTGKTKYLEDFEEKIQKIEIDSDNNEDLNDRMVDINWDWGNVRNLGVFTYVLSEREGRDPELLKQIKEDIIVVADSIVKNAQEDVYDRPLGERYYWGCNGTIARQTVNLQVANTISPKEIYKNTALDAISHILGRNYYNRSYITGVGIDPAKNPHDRRSMADDVEAPWPGYLVGGGHSATGWKDKAESYATNEIAINWQGALVYALAGFTSK